MNQVQGFRIAFPTTTLIFIPVFLYPPFVFSELVPEVIRIASFILLIAYLLLKARYFQKKDILCFALIAFVFINTLLVNLQNMEGLISAGGVTLTLIFALALGTAVKMNERIKRSVVSAYTFFFFLVPICSILSLIFFLLFGIVNLYNLPVSDYNYVFSPFGILLRNIFLTFNIYRSFFFFIEPTYLALFYTVNIFFVAPYLKTGSRLFLYLNVIGGLITFSYLFIIFSVILYLIRNVGLSPNNFIRVLLVLFLIAIILMSDFFSTSSLNDRIYRIGLFLKSMQGSGALHILFGQGYMAQINFDRAFSAGLLTMIYEIGVVNLIAIVLFFYLISNRNKYFLILLIPMLVFEPIKMPLYWVLIVVLSIMMSVNNRHSKGKNDLAINTTLN